MTTKFSTTISTIVSCWYRSNTNTNIGIGAGSRSSPLMHTDCWIRHRKDQSFREKTETGNQGTGDAQGKAVAKVKQEVEACRTKKGRKQNMINGKRTTMTSKPRCHYITWPPCHFLTWGSTAEQLLLISSVGGTVLCPHSLVMCSPTKTL